MKRRILHRLALAVLLQTNAAWSAEQAATEHATERHSEQTDPAIAAKDTEAQVVAAPLSSRQAARWADVIADIRTLFTLQDAAAAGSRDALTFQKAMLEQIAGKLAGRTPGGEPGVLIHAAIGFVLSGGNPSVADRLSEREDLDAHHRKLLRGASFYMEGNRKEAMRMFADVDALQLQPSIAGRVALVQAMMETTDGERRQALLEVAIASMPGSLVEESAIRRSTIFHAESGNQQPFWKRVNRYLRRFPRSPFAESFLTEVVSSVVKFEVDGAQPDRSQIDGFLTQVPMSSRRQLYIDLARRAALKNLVELTRFASRRSLRLSLPGSQEAQIAGLYSHIFEIDSSDAATTSVALRKLKRNLLPPLEQQLLEAGLAVLGAIDQPAAPSTLTTGQLTDGEEASEIWKAVELSLIAAEGSLRESFP